MGEHFSLSEITLNENGFTEELTKKINLNNISLPYIIKNRIIMSPGRWNHFDYSREVIQRMFEVTEWNERSRALFLEHDDKDSRSWVGDIKNIRFKNGSLIGDIYVVDRPLAIKLAYGAKFGVSPKIIGEANNKREVYEGKYGNFSVVLNPAVKTTFLNSEITIKNKEEGLAMEGETKVNEIKIDYQKLAETLADTMETRSAAKEAKAKIESELREKIKAEVKAELEEEIAAAKPAEEEKPSEDAEKPAEESAEAEKPAEEAAVEEEAKPAEELTDLTIVGGVIKETPVIETKDSKSFVAEMRETISPSQEANIECLPTEADFKMAAWLKKFV